MIGKSVLLFFFPTAIPDPGFAYLERLIDDFEQQQQQQRKIMLLFNLLKKELEIQHF